MSLQNATSRRGFTLIELLVVIAIIGILGAIVLANLRDARTKAQDTRRLSDVDQMQLALELYYDEHGYYPQYQATAGIDESDCGLNWCSLRAELAPYLKVPHDPTESGGSQRYYYEADSGDDYQTYGFMVLLQSDGQTDRMTEDGGFYPTIYEVGPQVTYCMQTYGGNPVPPEANWWGVQNTVCDGGN